MTEIRLKNIKKVYNKSIVAVNKIDLEIFSGEFVVLVGPSGCGKSTLLRMIAGLEDVTSGEIYFDGILSNNVDTKDRDVSFIFQNYALYPHLTVYNNLAFSMKVKKEKKSIIEAAVQKTAHMLKITTLLDRKPKELSGGEKQRVAMGRALIRKPKVFLMDEPLSNLDAKLRTQLRNEIRDIHQMNNSTTVYVTHDQLEAMTLGSKVVVMNNGQILQVGKPRNLYEKPKNIFVACFIGTPQMNIFNAEVLKKDIGYSLLVLSKELYLDKKIWKSLEGISSVKVGIRPEHIIIGKNKLFESKIKQKESTGEEIFYYTEIENKLITIKSTSIFDKNIGEEISYSFDFTHLHLFNNDGDSIDIS